MKQEINYSQFVDRYLDGVMSTEERNWFEKELVDDDELQLEVNLQSKINDSLAQPELLELEKQLDAIHDQIYHPVSTKIRFTGKVRKTLLLTSGIAAIGLLILTGVTDIFSGNSSNSDLYTNYYQPAEMNMSFRTAEDLVDSDLRSAMIYYENREYEQAIQLFETILETDNSRIGLNLYSGISHMEIQEYAKANANFQEIIDHKANAFIESAQWYLGLCYLMTNEVDKAEVIFDDIANTDGYYKKEARKILRKLK